MKNGAMPLIVGEVMLSALLKARSARCPPGVRCRVSLPGWLVDGQGDSYGVGDGSAGGGFGVVVDAGLGGVGVDGGTLFDAGGGGGVEGEGKGEKGRPSDW